MYTFESLVKMAADRHASDLHLSPGRVPSCRVDGQITGMLPDKLTANDTHDLAYQILGEKQRRVLEQNGEVDFAVFESGVGRFRVNIFRQRNSLVIVARILSDDIPDPKFLGIPESVVRAAQRKSGLILVTGPTGVGKTTTIASLIDQINHKYEKHIITLEDPIEYLHPHAKSIVNQREVGADTRSDGEGRVAAMEVMLSNGAIRNSIREGKVYQIPSIILTNKAEGMQTMDTAIAQLYADRKISREVAYSFAQDKEAIKRKVI